jgi:hypothetical protein
VAIQTCPSDIVAASAERIWKLLTQPTELAAWSGARLIEGPTHPLVPGDRVVPRSHEKFYGLFSRGAWSCWRSERQSGCRFRTCLLDCSRV